MKPHPHDAARAALRSFGLGLPGTETKSPWPEHMDLVVSGKTFVFMNVDGVSLRLSCKLPSSASMALALPFCSPTRFGLGRSGWVTAVFGDKDKPPVALLTEWALESYRAQAPKRLAKALAEKKVSSRAAAGATSAKNPKRTPRASSPQTNETTPARTAQIGSKKRTEKVTTKRTPRAR